MLSDRESEELDGLQETSETLEIGKSMVITVNWIFSNIQTHGPTYENVGDVFMKN